MFLRWRCKFIDQTQYSEMELEGATFSMSKFFFEKAAPISE